MKVDIEKIETEVKCLKDKEVFYLELSRDEATLILLCLSEHSHSSIVERLNKIKSHNYFVEDYKKAISLIEDKKSFPTQLCNMFDALAKELAK